MQQYRGLTEQQNVYIILYTSYIHTIILYTSYIHTIYNSFLPKGLMYIYNNPMECIEPIVISFLFR